MNSNTIAVPDNWHPKEMLEALANVAQGKSAIAEVGSWLGHSAIALAQHSAGVVYCIDHWQGSDSGTGLVDEPLKLYQSFLSNVQSAGVLHRIVPIFKSSADAAPLFRDRSLDLLFIDGSHFYEAVIQDLKLWVPKVKPGGLVCGDDYWEEGVVRAFSEYWPEREPTFLVAGRVWLVQL